MLKETTAVKKAKAFVYQTANDRQFAKALKEAVTPEEKRKILEEAGFGEVELRDLVTAARQPGGSGLSNDPLEKMSGSDQDAPDARKTFSKAMGNAAMSLP